MSHLRKIMSLLVVAVPLANAFAGETIQPQLLFNGALTHSARNSNRALHEVLLENEIQGHLKNKHRTLSHSQTVTGKYSEATKFQLYYDGIEVVGDMAFHHRTQNGTHTSKKITVFDLDTQPTLSSAEAVALAKSIGEDKQLAAEPKLLILPLSEQSAALIYLIELDGGTFEDGVQVLINAHSGAIMGQMPTHIDLAPVQVFSANTECQTLDKNGRPSDIRTSSCELAVRNADDQSSTDETAKRAAANSLTTLKYYSDFHQRDSYDGHGVEITSIVHVGEKFANAYWDVSHQFMAYGDGDGVVMGDMTLGLDVAGHEITHAVTSSTAKLIHQSESGALNESYSDFFGKMIENQGNWAIGHAVFIKPNPQGLRFISKPGVLIGAKIQDATTGKVTTYRYPAKMAEKIPEPTQCTDKNDYCWVHANSTIPSYAAYLIYQAVGKATAETIIYATLTQYLTATATFKSSRDATVEACKDLYSSDICDKVVAAYQQVGL